MSEGPQINPLKVIAFIRWLGDLSPDEMVRAIKIGADDAKARWPELSAADIAEMQRLCETITASRLRAWKRNARNSAEPTWLEVRALISGLYATFE